MTDNFVSTKLKQPHHIMNITKFVSTNIYLIMTLFICAISYIYVVNGLKCHIVLGVCSIGIESIVSYSVYVVLLSVCKEGMTRQKLSKRKPIVSGDQPQHAVHHGRDNALLLSAQRGEPQLLADAYCLRHGHHLCIYWYD